MFGLEIFLKLIGSSILKLAAKSLALKVVSSAIKVYSVFDALHSIHTCKDLKVFGLQIGYDLLSSKAINYLTREIRDDRYEIQRLDSGLYLAKTKILRHPIFVDSYSEYRALAPDGHRDALIYHQSDHRGVGQVGAEHRQSHHKIELRKDHRVYRKNGR